MYIIAQAESSSASWQPARRWSGPTLGARFDEGAETDAIVGGAKRLGGIRPYAAAGAQPVVHQVAEDHYRALFARTSVILPDALDRNPVPVALHTVAADGEYWLEDPRLSVAVYPLSTRHSTDSVLVLIRAGDEGFIYNGDLWSIGEDLGETIQNSLDMHKAIVARGIKADFMIGSHMRVREPVYVPYEQFKQIARVE